jgi:hypothetical protein
MLPRRRVDVVPAPLTRPLANDKVLAIVVERECRGPDRTFAAGGRPATPAAG